MDFPELINLFAAHRVASIGTVPEYLELCGRFASNVQFQRQRDTTEVAKRAIEEWLDNQPNYKAQVRQSFIMLQGNRIGDFDLYYALIVAGYKHRWSVAQQTYFDRVVPTIRNDNDFFLSFTSRGPRVGDKRINHRYWYFIRSEIGGHNITPDDRRNKNLLAEALYAMLMDATLKGFYYIRHEDDNTLVVDKLRKGLEGSRVFVQLVENVMFDPPDGRTNYCEFEYRHAVQIIGEEDRILFVVTEKCPDDLEDPARVHGPYRDWVEHIRSKSASYLPPVDDYNKQRLSELKKKLENIVMTVKGARRGVLERIPG